MVPQTKVFVGSLPQGSRPEDLRKMFERYGTVTECDIMNRCGFVHMQTEEQATAAIRALNNSPFNGGVITVERGRIKERGARGGGARGGMRGGMRGVGERRGGGGPMRGGPMGAREAPYMRDARPMGMRDMRGGPMGGMARNGLGGAPYERGMDRGMGGYDDGRYGGYGGEDRRGFALMERREYGAAPMYDEGRYGEVEELPPLYDHRRPLYDERELMDRRALRAPMPMPNGYERARAAPLPNGDMFSRRSPMRGAAAGGYDRGDPYGQQYPPMGRGGGAARGGRDAGGARRY